jgi:hypothetical protein
MSRTSTKLSSDPSENILENVSFLNMQTPTTAQLLTAIEVLTKLGERLNIEAAYSITQFPETQLGVHYAGNIGALTLEQTARIETVAMQLKNWHDELLQQGNGRCARTEAKTRLHNWLNERVDGDKIFDNVTNATADHWSDKISKSYYEVKDFF